MEITFGDQTSNPIQPIRLAKEDFYSRICDESTEGNADYVVVDMSAEPEFTGRYEFEPETADGIIHVDDQVLFFGFPFLGSHLTSHVGYISADYVADQVHHLQIDGSINRGNSGGPLFHPASGKAIAIVTRTELGLERDFDQLVEAIGKNVQGLSRQRASMTIGGIDPVQATRTTMVILGRLANNLRRSANVGIGWAFCTEHLLSGGALNKAEEAK